MENSEHNVYNFPVREKDEFVEEKYTRINIQFSTNSIYIV